VAALARSRGEAVDRDLGGKGAVLTRGRGGEEVNPALDRLAGVGVDV